jgi:hypothetical protein
MTIQEINKQTEEKTTKLFNEMGMFFAFSNKQFDEQKKEGVVYVNFGMGGICPKENAEKCNQELNKIVDWKIEEMKKISPDFLIEYELSNHEAYYTGDIEEAFQALKHYGFTRQQVRAVYKKTYHKYEDQ